MSDKPEDDWSKMIPQVITLSAEDYDAFVEVMCRDQKPTEGAIRGAEQLRKLCGPK